jgi:co-chaperonin GroES (HSP10)
MKFTKFSPFGKRAVLKLDSSKTMTEGGIIIPESAQRPSNTATVISFGEECTKVKEGMKVLIPQNIGVEIEMLNETFFMVFEGDIDGEIE